PRPRSALGESPAPRCRLIGCTSRRQRGFRRPRQEVRQGGLVGRTPWSAADAPVGLPAPREVPTSLFRQRDEGVPAQRAPRPGGPPHHLSFAGRRPVPKGQEACPTLEYTR